MMRRLHITMTHNLFNWIKANAIANGLSVSSFITYNMNQIKKEKDDDPQGIKDSQLIERNSVL